MQPPRRLPYSMSGPHVISPEKPDYRARLRDRPGAHPTAALG
jgi:hypothetical protein